jgi:hypothetical protein
MVTDRALASYQVDQAADGSVGFRPAFHSSSSNPGAGCPGILPPGCSGNTRTPYHRSTQEVSLRIYIGKDTLIVQSG